MNKKLLQIMLFSRLVAAPNRSTLKNVGSAMRCIFVGFHVAKEDAFAETWHGLSIFKVWLVINACVAGSTFVVVVIVVVVVVVVYHNG